MFSRFGRLWDVVIFALIFACLAAWQLRYAYEMDGRVAESILLVAACVFGIGLFFTGRWGLIGVCLTLTAATLVYFAQVWLDPIVHEDTSWIMPNIIKLVVSILLFIYIGRQSVEDRFSSS